MNALTQLHVDIEARVSAIRDDNLDWLMPYGLRRLLPTAC